jgi:hypothetical protein
LAAAVIPQHEAWLWLRDEADTYDGWNRVAPPGVLQDGREGSLWPMLAGWRVPHGYHPITYAALEAAMRAWGYDSDRFLDATGVIVRVGRDGVAWRPNAGVAGAAADAEAIRVGRIVRETRRDPNKILVLGTQPDVPIPYDVHWGRGQHGLLLAPVRDGIGMALVDDVNATAFDGMPPTERGSVFNFFWGRWAGAGRLAPWVAFVTLAFIVAAELLQSLGAARQTRRQQQSRDASESSAPACATPPPHADAEESREESDRTGPPEA